MTSSNWAPRVWSLLLLAGCAPPAALEALGAEPIDAGLPAPVDAGASSLPLASRSLLHALTLSGGALVPAFAPDVLDYTVTSLNSRFPVTVTAATREAAAFITVQGQPVGSGSPVEVTLSQQQDLEVVVTGQGSAPREYRVHYRPPSLPAFTVWTGAAHGTEQVLLTPNAEALMAVDRAGALLFYRLFKPASVYDFQQHVLPTGERVYSYWLDDPKEPGGAGTRLMNERFEDLGSAGLLPHDGDGVIASDVHDFILLGDQHYVALANPLRLVDLSGFNRGWSGQALVVAAVVQEVDHGVVVFEWDSTEHPRLYADSVDGNTFQEGVFSDYLHINSVQIDPLDQNFIISLRHSDSVLKLDRTTGATLWTLGGRSDEFHLTPEQRFSHQHFARRQADGSLQLFDNGNGVHQTRVLSLRLDEATRTLKSFEVLCAKPADLPQTVAMGSVSALPGDRELIGWGAAWGSTVLQPAVTEMVNGVPAWSLTFDDPSVFSYRAMPAN